MGDTPAWGRYYELRPAELEAIRAKAPAIYLPWGALEWHGPHLPLGLDGVAAEAVASGAIRRTGGVLMPTTWWPAGAVPHRDSLSAPAESLSALLDSLFARNGQTLSELCEGRDMTRQAVTKHLGVLEDANLVATVRRGREKLHYLNPVPIHEIGERWISKYERGRLAALSDLKKALESQG